MTAAQVAFDLFSALGTNLILFIAVLVACLVSKKSKTAGIIIYILGITFQTLSIIGQAKQLNYYYSDYAEAQFYLALIISVAISLIGIIVILKRKNKTRDDSQQGVANGEFSSADELVPLFECKKYRVRFSEQYNECPVCHAVNSFATPVFDSGNNMSDPIFVCGEDGLKQYFSSLKTDRNETITWSALGTYPVKDIGLVRSYKASTKQGYYKTIYVSINGTDNPSAAPKGFVLCSVPTKTTIEHTCTPAITKETKRELEQVKLQDNDTIITYCRKCGAQLVDGCAFCRKCGTPISISGVQEQEKRSITCSQSQNEEPKAIVESASSIQSPVEEPKQNPAFEIDLLDKSLHPKIRRASIYAEDAEWEKAEACLEAVLDEDPTNAYAYIGKLLVDYKVTNTADLLPFAEALNDNKNYQKAVRFADEQLMRQLMAIQRLIDKKKKTV